MMMMMTIITDGNEDKAKTWGVVNMIHDAWHDAEDFS